MNTSGSNWSENKSHEQLQGDKLVYAEVLRIVNNAYYNVVPVLSYQLSQELPVATPQPSKNYDNRTAVSEKFIAPDQASAYNPWPTAEQQQSTQTNPLWVSNAELEQAARQDLEDIYG